jgi:hypothetical protein
MTVCVCVCVCVCMCVCEREREYASSLEAHTTRVKTLIRGFMDDLVTNNYDGRHGVIISA